MPRRAIVLWAGWLGATVILLAPVVFGQTPGWFWQNPLPQGSTLNSVWYVDNSTGYAVGNGGTIMKTTTGGASWTLQNSGVQGGLRSVQFPVDAQTGYAVGASDTVSNPGQKEGIIMKTTNGGADWVRQTSGIRPGLNAVHFPVDANTGYAVGWPGSVGGYVLKTTDGGANWVRQDLGAPYLLRTVYFPRDAQTGYVAGREWPGASSAILKTTDGGGTWVRLNTSGSVCVEVKSLHFPLDADTGYAAGTKSGIPPGVAFKTTDGGATWFDQAYLNVESYASINFPVDAQTGYIAGGADRGAFYKTTDGGFTWIEPSQSIQDRYCSVQFPVNTQTGYVVGEYGLLLKTTNAGANLILQNSNETYLTNTGWAAQLSSVHFPADAQVGYAVGAGAIVLKTTNGGANWSCLRSIGGGSDFNSVHFVDAQTGYTVGGYVGGMTNIRKTTDGGTTWQQQTSPLTQDLHGVYFPPGNAQTGYAVSGQSPGGIIKTTDGGANWLTLTTAVRGSCVNFPVDSRTGYVVSSRDTVWKTTDGGTSWAAQFTGIGLYGYLMSVHFPTDAQTGYAVGNAYEGGYTPACIVKTTNGGATWVTVYTGSSYQCFKSVHFANAQTGYVVGSDMNYQNPILKTTDGGTTWVEQASHSSWTKIYGLQDVYFTNAGTGYIVGDGGAILKTTTGGSGVEEEREGSRQLAVSSMKATPNPLTSFARIPGHERERFAVYDIAGRRVAVHKGDRIGEGLSPGVYFLKPESQAGKPIRIVKVR